VTLSPRVVAGPLFREEDILYLQAKEELTFIGIGLITKWVLVL
jgi:hypothetical protein